MYDDAPRVDLIGRKDSDDGSTGSASRDHTIGVRQTETDFTRGHPLDDRCIRSAAKDFNLNAGTGVVTMHGGSIIASVFRLREPVESQALRAILRFGAAAGQQLEAEDKAEHSPEARVAHGRSHKRLLRWHVIYRPGAQRRSASRLRPLTTPKNSSPRPVEKRTVANR